MFSELLLQEKRRGEDVEEKERGRWNGGGRRKEGSTTCMYCTVDGRVGEVGISRDVFYAAYLVSRGLDRWTCLVSYSNI